MKILIVFLLITIAPIFMYVSCCNCPDFKEKFYKISALTVNAYGSSNATIDTGAVTSVDTIYVKYEMIQDCIADASEQFRGFLNAAYACYCSGCGYNGLKSKIKNFVITSDTKYNDTLPAGNSLNQIFRVKKWNYYQDHNKITLDTVKTKLNEGYQDFSLVLYAVIKPAPNSTHRFTLTIEMENGEKVTSVTKPINWQ